MNQKKYDSLPADLKKVIDTNSGQAFSGQIGKVFLEADAEGKKLASKNTFNVIPKAELENWKKAGQPLIDAWVTEVTAKGANGKQLIDGARAPSPSIQAANKTTPNGRPMVGRHQSLTEKLCKSR